MARGDLLRLERLAWIYRLFSALLGFFALGFLGRLVGPSVAAGNWHFAGCGIVYALVGVAWAGGLLAASFHLRQGTRHSFCLAMGASLLILFPFGTAAGAMALSLLRRPSVRELFREG